MTTQEQIEFLNKTVMCKIAPSGIHGVGVFAIRDIKEGECFVQRAPRGMSFDVPLEKMNEIVLPVRALIFDRWAQPEGGAPFASPNDDANLMSFINHASKPNTAYGKALRDIKKGEELTEDYTNLGAVLSPRQMAHYSFLLNSA